MALLALAMWLAACQGYRPYLQVIEFDRGVTVHVQNAQLGSTVYMRTQHVRISDELSRQTIWEVQDTKPPGYSQNISALTLRCGGQPQVIVSAGDGGYVRVIPDADSVPNIPCGRRYGIAVWEDGATSLRADFSFSSAGSPRPWNTPIPATVCEIKGEPWRYSGSLVEVRGRILIPPYVVQIDMGSPSPKLIDEEHPECGRLKFGHHSPKPFETMPSSVIDGLWVRYHSLLKSPDGRSALIGAIGLIMSSQEMRDGEVVATSHDTWEPWLAVQRIVALGADEPVHR
jgi:hypothetical protein